MTDAGFPCLIREILYAPPCPEPVAALFEVALTHHNTGNYIAALNTYMNAQALWESHIVKQKPMASGSAGSPSMSPAHHQQHQHNGSEASSPHGHQNQSSQNNVNTNNVHSSSGAPELPIEGQAFLRLAVGSVMDSAGSDESALSEYLTALQLCESALHNAHPILGSVFSCLGAVYYHLSQYDLSLDYMYRALELREETLGPDHVDTGLMLNNVGVCLHVLGRCQDALVLYYRAEEIFKSQFRLDHPRAVTVRRNIGKVKSFFLHENDFIAPTYVPLKIKMVPGAVKGKKWRKAAAKKK
eukprot:PhM_4_TR8738/c0_g1_i1/m.82579